MHTFKESGLEFKFPDKWSVIKSDDHRFYKYLSGSGLKSVDFIALDGVEHMYFIEVKNYNDRFEENGRAAMQPLLEDPKGFVNNIIQKFEDSLQLIRVVNKYYNRKFWFRWLKKITLKQLRNRSSIPQNWKYWLTAHELLTGQEQSITLILFLEIDDSLTAAEKSTFFGQATEYLRQHYENKDRKILVIDAESKGIPFKTKYLVT